jgi:hypothetical protein
MKYSCCKRGLAAPPPRREAPMKRFLILPALCLFLAAHRAVAALTFAPISATADCTGVNC